MSDVCCALLCPPAVEENLLDALLLHFPGSAFVSAPAFGHGTPLGALGAGERVAGRARGVLVQIRLSAAQWTALKSLLASNFAGTAIRYWATPLVEEGVCA